MANKIQKLKNSTNDTIYPVTVKDAIYDNSGNPLSIADTASVVAIDAKVGDLSLLTTANKTSAVNAINEVDSDVTSLVNTVNGINSNINVVDNKIGNLTTLTTIEKTNLVGAVNELDSDVGAVDNKIGLLSALQTIDKTDVVSAINENSSAIGQLAKFNRVLTSSDNLFLLTGDKYTIYKIEAETPLNSPIINLTYSIVEFIPFGASGQRKLVISNYEQSEVVGKKWEIMLQPNGTPYQEWKEIMKTDNFTQTSQPLVVGSGFEAQTGASPFNVTKSGQMLYFIGQLKCLANTTSSPVVLATSPIFPAGYFYLNILVNGVRQEGLTIAPGTGQIYIYKSFSANDIINFNGFAIGDI